MRVCSKVRVSRETFIKSCTSHTWLRKLDLFASGTQLTPSILSFSLLPSTCGHWWMMEFRVGWTPAHNNERTMDDGLSRYCCWRACVKGTTSLRSGVRCWMKKSQATGWNSPCLALTLLLGWYKRHLGPGKQTGVTSQTFCSVVEESQGRRGEPRFTGKPVVTKMLAKILQHSTCWYLRLLCFKLSHFTLKQLLEHCQVLFYVV